MFAVSLLHGHYVAVRVVYGYEWDHKAEVVNVSKMYNCLELCQKKLHGMRVQ
jgi:hypothetical protein